MTGTTKHRKPLNHRAFVAIAAALAGLGLPVTGVANHYLQTDPIAGPRHAWMSAHNALGLLFVVFAVWHVVLNRRAFTRYAKGFSVRATGVSREVAWAVVTVGFALAVAVGHTFMAA